MSNKKHRGFVFTINNYTDNDIAAVMQEATECEYLIAGFEVGKSGTPHIQGYMYYKNQRYLTGVLKNTALIRAHIEVAKGNSKQNYDYCTKDGDFWESGELPTQGLITKAKLEQIMDNPYENFHLYNQYRKCYKELQRATPKEHKRRLMLLDYNDRYKVASEFKSVLFIPEEKFDLYNEERCVIMDYSPSIYRHIYDWINGFPMTIRRGYEMMKFDPEFVYIMYSSSSEYATLRKLYHKLISF